MKKQVYSLAIFRSICVLFLYCTCFALAPKGYATKVKLPFGVELETSVALSKTSKRQHSHVRLENSSEDGTLTLSLLPNATRGYIKLATKRGAPVKTGKLSVFILSPVSEEMQDEECTSAESEISLQIFTPEWSSDPDTVIEDDELTQNMGGLIGGFSRRVSSASVAPLRFDDTQIFRAFSATYEDVARENIHFSQLKLKSTTKDISLDLASGGNWWARE